MRENGDVNRGGSYMSSTYVYIGVRTFIMKFGVLNRDLSHIGIRFYV